MKRLGTLSALPLLSVCPGAGALPWVGSVNESAALGNALHEWIEHLVSDPEFDSPIGAGHFAEKWDLGGDDARRYYYLASSFRPDIPAGALAEVPLAMLTDGRVVRLPGGGRGEYPDAPDGTILAGSLDVMWAKLGSDPEWIDEYTEAPKGELVRLGLSPEALLEVYDWKTGDAANVAPAARNWQIKGAVLLASRWTRATKAIGGICHVAPGPGIWDQELFEEDDILAIEIEIRDLLHRVEEARLAVAAGDQPELVTGAHCEHCPARAACPAWVAPVRALMARPGELFDPRGPVTAWQGQRAAELLPALRTLVDMCKTVAEEGVRLHGPLPLACGKVFGPAEETRETLGVRATYEELEALVGAEKADGAFRVTKDGIREALREGAAPRGSYGRLMAKLDERGAVAKRRLTVYRARHVAEPVALAMGQTSEEGQGA